MSIANPDGQDPAAQLAKLRRRLERERQIRCEAEAIAEKGLRELFEKQRQLQLLESIAVSANQTSSVRDALQAAVTAICDFEAWPLGHVHLADTRDGVTALSSAAIWHSAAPERFTDFCRISEQMRFEQGVGLPGRVLAARAACWVTDASEDDGLPRTRAAVSAGLKAAFAFPVLIGAEVAAVLEFFTDRYMDPDRSLMQFTPHIGAQLSRVIERKRAEDQLLHDASHDPLTGLPNRSLFVDRLMRVVARVRRHPEQRFAVLFVDLDRFKVVNDSLGHHAGDALLIEVSARLRASLRREDLVARAGPEGEIAEVSGSEAASPEAEEGDSTLARLGGDEFTVLLDDLEDPNDAVRVADRIHEALKQPFGICGQEVYVTASVGIASGDTRYHSADDVLRDADLAMYRAKALGKSRSEVYDQGLHASAMKRLTLETELRHALEHEQFVLHYQPIVSLGDGGVVGFEALVRWRRSESELVPPGDFIPIAEDTGLILYLGPWVLREACRKLKAWQEQFPRAKPLTMSVNVSAKQFAQPDLVSLVRRVLAESAVDPSTLRLEITETVTMGDAERTVRVLSQLRSLGIRLSIDDFGTGYSSLSYLHRFPLDVLKIDRSFVSDMDTRSESLQVVRTIMNLARQLGMDVVAEGAETDAHVSRLKALGCGYGQGFYFSRPVEPTAIESLLRAETLPVVADPEPGKFGPASAARVDASAG